MEILITPYKSISDKEYNNDFILIKPDNFKDYQFIPRLSTFSFSHCCFEKFEIKNEQEIEFGDVLISFNFCLLKYIRIEALISEKISINFNGCIVEGNIDTCNLKNLSFSNCILKSLFLKNLKKIDFHYYDEIFSILEWKKMLKKTDFENIDNILSFKQRVYIFDSEVISINTLKSQKSISGVSRDLYDRNRLIFKLNEMQKNLLNINININSLQVLCKEVRILNSFLNSLIIKGNAEGRISIENTKINYINFYEFSIKGEMLIYNLSPYKSDSKYVLNKSNMDNCWFDNIDFNSYEIISFFRSRFAKAFFTSCNFPEDNLSFEKFKILENEHYSDLKPDNYYKDQYETFLQLKKALENSNNFYEALKLGAIAKESLRKVPGLPLEDKFILYSNKISNNYGRSITRPLLGIFLSSILLYIFYLVSVNKFHLSCCPDWKLIRHYFSFLDISHKNDFLVIKENLSIISIIIDFFNKIVIGFFAFQFIFAFRKYVNK